jgi:hypothetical protein
MHATLRSIGALAVAAVLSVALFSLSAATQAPAAHAAGDKTTATKKAPSRVEGRAFPTEAELRAAAKRHKTKNGRPVARTSAAVAFRVEWWGVRVLLDRELGCGAVRGIPELENLIKTFVPVPWNYVVIGAIKVHKYLINARMGDHGVELHFNWGGFFHWANPIGLPKAC